MTPGEIEPELERLHPAAFAWALGCCGRNREDALDVLQTSYLKVLDGRARFDGRSSFKTFLFGVIRRTSSELRRRDGWRGIFFERERQDSTFRADAEPEQRLTLVKALGSLPRRQRQTLHLVFYFGMTVEEAASTLSISVGSARTHYTRGKRRLLQALSGGGAR